MVNSVYSPYTLGAHFKGLDAGAPGDGLYHFGGNYLKGSQIAQQIGAHAAVGGISAELQGGKFGHGFFSAGVTKAIGGALLPGGDDLSTKEIVQGTIVSAIIGGTASVISGGKFANGAQTGAFQYLFNQAGRIKHLFVEAVGKRSYITQIQLSKAIAEVNDKIEALTIEDMEENYKSVFLQAGRNLDMAKTILGAQFRADVANPVVAEMAESLTFQAIADVYLSPGISRFSPLQKLFIGEMINAAGPSNKYDVDKIHDFLKEN